MTESHPIPAIAKTAYALLRAQYHQDEYERDLNAIGQQTVVALGLALDGGWTVDLNAGVVRRELADDAQPSAPLPST